MIHHSLLISAMFVSIIMSVKLFQYAAACAIEPWVLALVAVFSALSPIIALVVIILAEIAILRILDKREWAYVLYIDYTIGPPERNSLYLRHMNLLLNYFLGPRAADKQSGAQCPERTDEGK